MSSHDFLTKFSRLTNKVANSANTDTYVRQAKEGGGSKGHPHTSILYPWNKQGYKLTNTFWQNNQTE